MRTQKRIRDRRRPAARVTPGAPVAAAALAALVLLGPAAASATADPSPAASAAASAPAPAAGLLPAEASQAERLAAELRKSPVYISADLPREVPRSLAPGYAEAAERTGVPTYVLVLPDSDRTLLAQVHDRLGTDGLYVLVEKYGGVTVSAFGVDLPAEDAARIANRTVSYDAGPLARFTAFTEKVTQGKDQVAAEARALEQHYDDDPPRAYISSTDRQNQNLLLGLAVVVIPGVLLSLGLWFARRRPLRPGPPARGTGAVRRPAVDLGKKPPVALTKAPAKAQLKKGGTKAGTKGGGRPRPAALAPAPLRRSVLVATLLVAVASVFGVVLAAPSVFPQTIDDPDLTVTRADLEARTTEAAAALTADGGIYQDASAPNPLTPEQLAAVRQRMGQLATKTPVFLLFTSSDGDDESAGDSSALLAQVHRQTGRDGVYVQVDPVGGYLQVEEYAAAETDLSSRFRKADLRYPDREGTSNDLKIPERLNTVLDEVAAARPTGDEGYTGDRETLPELRSNRLPPLFSNDFGGGITLGVMLLAVLLLLAWAAVATARAVLRSRHARSAAPTPARPTSTGPRHTATHPSARQLRSWATEDARALAVRLAAVDQDDPRRARAWDCLDAAQLLLGEDGGRTADPSDLAAAVALARAGADTLEGRRGPRLCRLSPLHGIADGGKVPSWFTTVDLGPTSAQLCAECRDLLQLSGVNRYGAADPAARRAETDKRLLRLPDEDGRGTVAWNEEGEVLPAALEGVEALVEWAREAASVQ